MRPDPPFVESPYLLPEQAGDYLHLSGGTLANWRRTGKGPDFRRHGRVIVYAVSDLDAWSLLRREQPTTSQEVSA